MCIGVFRPFQPSESVGFGNWTVTGQDAGASGDSAAAAASFHGGRGRDSPDQLGAAAEGGDDAQTLHRSDTPAALTSAGGGISTAFLLPLNI